MTVSKHLASLDLGPARHLLMNNDPYVRRAHAGTSPPAAVPCMSTLTPVGGFVGNLDPRPTWEPGVEWLRCRFAPVCAARRRGHAHLRITSDQPRHAYMARRWAVAGPGIDQAAPHAHMVPLLHETDLIIRRARGVTDRS